MKGQGGHAHKLPHPSDAGLGTSRPRVKPRDKCPSRGRCGTEEKGLPPAFARELVSHSRAGHYDVAAIP
jgi:hypothetical protein